MPAKLKELTEEVCAFANSVGGFLLIGVDNKNAICGVEIDNNKGGEILISIFDDRVEIANPGGKKEKKYIRI